MDSGALLRGGFGDTQPGDQNLKGTGMSLLRPSSTGCSIEEVKTGLRDLLFIDGSKQRPQGMALYCSVYSLCTRLPLPLTKELAEVLLEILLENLKSLFEQIRASPEVTLSAFDEACGHWEEGTRRLSAVCHYYNRQTQSDTLKGTLLNVIIDGDVCKIPLMPVQDMAYLALGRELGRSGVPWPEIVAQKLRNSRLRAFELGRQRQMPILKAFFGTIMNCDAVLKKAGMTFTLPVKLFVAIHKETGEFYRQRAHYFLERREFPAYLDLCQAALLLEDHICQELSSGQTMDGFMEQLKAVLLRELIQSNAQRYSEIFWVLAQANDFPSLRRLFDLMRIGVAEMLPASIPKLLEYLRGLAQGLINGQFLSPHDGLLALSSLLGELQYYEDTLNDTAVSETIKTIKRDILSCQVQWTSVTVTCLNSLVTCQSTNSEKLAPYADAVSFVSQQSDFAASYQRSLAKRLLYNQPVYLGLEETILKAFPRDLAYNCQRMIKDKLWNEGREVDILARLFWSAIPEEILECQLQVPLPQEFKRICHDHENRVKQRDKHKTVAWMPQLSSVDVEYQCGGREIRLLCNVPQALLLRKLSDAGMSIDEAKAFLGASDVIFDWLFKPLVESELVLSNGEWLSVNSEITTDSPILLIPSFELDQGLPTQMEISDAEHASTTLSQQNKTIMQCLVMQLLKRNRAMSRSHLHQQVQTGWSRPVRMTVSDFEECLEALMGREFIEYDEKDAVYRYLP